MQGYRWMGRAVLATAVVLGAPCSSAAAAEDAPISAEDNAKAIKFLAEGNKAFRLGHFADAEAAYEKAFALKRVHDIAGNLGMTEFAQGKQREAAEHLAVGLRLFPITGEPAQRDQMQKTLDQCKKSVGTVKVNVSVRGALVYLDTKLVGETPLPDDVYIEAGEHTLEAKADGYKPMSQKVKADKGSALEATFNLAALPKPKGKTIIVEVPVKRRSIVPAIVGGAGAVAAAGVGLTLFLLSNSKRSDAINNQDKNILAAGKNCIDTPADPACVTLADTARSVDTYRYISVGTFIGAGALAVGSLAYALWPSPRPKKTGLDVHVAPVAGQDHGAMIIWGAF